jgi:hypothetical protein
VTEVGSAPMATRLASPMLTRSGLGRLVVVVAFLFLFARAAPAAQAGPVVVVLDSHTGRTIRSIPLPDEPTRVSYGAGVFWAVVPPANLVVRIRPRGDSQRLRVAKEPYDAATGAGHVWVPRHDGFDLVGLPLRQGTVRRTSGLPGGPQLAIAYAFGAVWSVAADGALRRLDPRTLAVTGTVGGVSFSSEGFEPKIAVAADALWVADAVRHVVSRIDPRRLRVTATVAHGGNGVAVLGPHVWSSDGSFAWRLAGGRISKLRTGNGPLDVAAGGGAIWVANRFSHTLARIDPRSVRVTKTISLPGRISAIAYGGVYLAVALF